MGTPLPPALRTANTALGAGVTERALASASARISDTYRAQGGSSDIRSAADVAAYAAARLPATFAAVSAALAELERQRPDIQLKTLLDVGCGPASASLAAIEHYPNITDIALLDHSRPLLETAGRLLGESGYAQGRRIEPLHADVRHATLPAADLVMLAYALVEIDAGQVADLVRRLYAASRQALVLVEPGSQEGFGRIALAREVLRTAGARLLAPCTHETDCPIAAPDWCHFSVRLARSRAHRIAKSAAAPFEDEKFSYLIAGPVGALPGSGGRIVAPPWRSKAGIELRTCGPGGLERVRIAARDPRYRAARRLDWGEVLPLEA